MVEQARQDSLKALCGSGRNNLDKKGEERPLLRPVRSFPCSRLREVLWCSCQSEMLGDMNWRLVAMPMFLNAESEEGKAVQTHACASALSSLLLHERSKLPEAERGEAHAATRESVPVLKT